MARRGKAAVFLDRDGVLIEDVHLLTDSSSIRMLPGVPAALKALVQAHFHLFVVSNQTVVARGYATEQQVSAVNDEINRRLQQANAPSIDRFYFCPHHPQATLQEYRVTCECRKPRAGLFFKAALEHGLSLADSFAVGDRITDIIAGAKAGCRTILVHSGKHLEAPIQTVEPIDESIKPDHVCANLHDAALWILENQ